jgi:hypothetical protein
VKRERGAGRTDRSPTEILPAAKNTSMKPTLDTRSIPLAISLLVFLFSLLLVALTSMAYNQGHLGYSLDDPYIHLALAKNLARGHYGINPGEVCTPSSSILWPFLLVPGFWLGGALWLPLLWNTLAGIGALGMASQLLSLALRRAPEARRPVAHGVLLVGFIFASNLVGLVFTGMEHTLHLALSLAAFYGLVRERDENRAPSWLGIVLGLIPLVRYEGLAMTAGAIVYLLVRRRFGVALTALVLALVPLVAFSVFSHSHHLGLLPNSIAAKVRVHGEHSALETLRRNILLNISRPEAVELVVLITLVLQAALRRAWRGVLLWAGGAGIVHLLLGAIGWFGRYEPYIVAVLLAALALSRGRVLGKTRPLTLAGITAVLSLLYLPPTLETAEATNDIYLQQYQMQRLAQLWDAPVAVNDIGWVAFSSKHYVLDLFGLANREALERNKHEVLSKWVEDMTKRHKTQLVMVYDNWFPPQYLPPSWIRVGALEMSRPVVSVGRNQVTLYATDTAAAQRLVELLPAYARNLPPQAFFRFTNGRILMSEALERAELAAR